jgi:hypothetical protein
VNGLGRPLDKREQYYVGRYVTGNHYPSNRHYPVMNVEQDNTAM